MLQYLTNNNITSNYSIHLINNQVISNNPEALLTFTCLTINNLLSCTTLANYPIVNGKRLPALHEFIYDLYKKNNIPNAVKLFTLIYLLRLKSKLPEYAKGGPDTPYRLFLAAVLTSSKYLSENGTGLTSNHLSHLTHTIYTAKDINRMERSFLGLIRYDLWVSPLDIQSFLSSYGDIIQMNYY